MDPNTRVAILIDGEFAKKVLQKNLARIPVASEVSSLCQQIMQRPELADFNLYRVYYYTADPLRRGTVTNPLDGSQIQFATTSQSKENLALLDALEHEPDFAVRRGTLAVHGWKLTTKAARAIERKQQTQISASDLAPNIQQKGVDMRIGLEPLTSG